MKLNTQFTDSFQERHLDTTDSKLKSMFSALDIPNLDALIDQAVPASIRLKNKIKLPKPMAEHEFLKEFKKIVSNNQVFRSYIGMGYTDTITPKVILRNVLENPGWYTAYTPYQAEIAQGRLEALMNFQTMICELTAMDIANASLLDESTAAAEAMTLLYNAKAKNKKDANTFFVADSCHPQTIDVLKTRALPLGIELIVGDIQKLKFSNNSLFGNNIFGVLLQYPGSTGEVIDYTPLIKSAHDADILVAVATDLLSLTMLTPPGEMGADVVVGSSQRFGVPMGYGGPHAAFFATKDQHKRVMPGRIIGTSVDTHDRVAYRMALQTREQHIRREKATSNICTAQVLLAVMASFYGVYHGPDGLKQIAERIHGYTCVLDKALQKSGYKQINKNYFDTLCVEVKNKDVLKSIAENEKINLRYLATDHVCITLDETIDLTSLQKLVTIFQRAANQKSDITFITEEYDSHLPSSLLRKTAYMKQKVFNTYHTEHGMLRYIKRLEAKDLSLVHSMISLGSCTMKLNATTEMIPVTWEEIGGLHPMAPTEQAAGYKEIFKTLGQWLCEITGFAGISFQPNSGAQGEYAGLMVIREYHRNNNEGHRNISLIPASAHGTNPASAVMAGMKVVVVACDDKGNIDTEDLKQKAAEHKDYLSCLMVTYPSTHGVFEEGIKEICDLIHSYGGMVYMDGANMNAQVGLTSPGFIGADVCHLNLHKTFCIPHGGGGPGVGPIGVAAHLVDYLPGHAVINTGGSKAITAVSAAPWGSASILPISYAYIAMMGGEGLTRATKMAILNANYMLSRLKEHYPILYTAASGRCAHEFIVDCRPFKTSAGIEVEDLAKRLMDYGFHAPTVSFPVAGTLMIEPTESETKEELDRFCDALIAIREEIKEIENGIADKEDNPLKNAPHTAQDVMASDWSHAYSREKAAYPLPYVRLNKFWPSVSRINGAYGDRNLVCSCDPIEAYA